MRPGAQRPGGGRDQSRHHADRAAGSRPLDRPGAPPSARVISAAEPNRRFLATPPPLARALQNPPPLAGEGRVGDLSASAAPAGIAENPRIPHLDPPPHAG